MLTEQQVEEIREHLEKAQNPLFFFDNDNDGLTSFLLLRRSIDRGKGIPIKTYPELDSTYLKRVEELNPDYIFILDKPDVSPDFLKQIIEKNLPIVWIDHHQTEEKTLDPLIHYYNPYLNDKTSEPVSYISYKITNKKEDLWIATIGCISDAYLPDFYPEFLEKYPELGKKPTGVKPSFDLLYNTEIGKIARILDFSLKDTTTNVVNMLKFMMKAKNPLEVLEENKNTEQILKKFNEVNEKYQLLLNKARASSEDNFIYFSYSGETSMSSNLANQLSFEFPDKLIVIAYLKENFANISLRWKDDVRSLTLSVIKDIPGATGGGHTNATGAKVLQEHLPKFKGNIEKYLEKEKNN
ncbi:hypothetical protein CMI42_05110 [Candidatus Pacearchaeota archaeon]|nr:hypothetical protein [Candidatus Pacearchaeota archaeon]|tara:strand:+ start:494 stop:1555 length:1062 start_codon:yes stop_codon:yes gene_type:complete